MTKLSNILIGATLMVAWFVAYMAWGHANAINPEAGPTGWLIPTYVMDAAAPVLIGGTVMFLAGFFLFVKGIVQK